MNKGIDISQYQGDVNFDQLAGQLQFIIARASFGAPDPGQPASNYVDPKFARNQSEMRRIGIQRGFYHFSYPQFNSAEAEAKQFLGTIGQLQPGEFIALDFEEKAVNPVQWAKTWLDAVYAATGVRAFVYMNQAFLMAYDWSSVSVDYPLWIALWNNQPDQPIPAINWPAGVYIHQYGLSDLIHADGDVSMGDLSLFGFKDTIITGQANAVLPVHIFPKYVTVTSNAYVRTSPHIRSDNIVNQNNVVGKNHVAWILAPLTFEMVDIVTGDAPKGSTNNKWLKTAGNDYIWSGATNYQV